MSINEIEGTLEIEYPCRWLYKVIGSDADAVRQAVLETIEIEDVTLELSHTSGKGNFVSFNVEVTVTSTEERTGIYEALKAHGSIRMVL